MSILIIGSSNSDVYYHLDKLPEKGETVIGNHISYRFGGKGANQAVAAARMSSQVCFLTCVGNDGSGKAIIDNLKREKVDVSYIKVTSDLPTGTAAIHLDSEGSNTIVVIKGANEVCDADYILSHKDLFLKHDYILLQMEIPVTAIETAIKLAYQNRKKLVFNPAPAHRIEKELYHYIDFLIPNETELELLAFGNVRNREVDVCAKTLLEFGVRHLIVTLGEKGVIYYSRTKKEFYPSRTVRAVDTVGAGDCFNACFVSALEKGLSIGKAIEFANVAASISVTRYGAQESMPGYLEVQQVLLEGNDRKNG